MKKSLKWVSFLLFVPFFISCLGSDDSGVPATSISQYIATNSQYSTLALAIDRADLTVALSAPGSVTFFAPTNEAFDAYLNELGVSLFEIPVNDLRELLLNHVVPVATTANNISTGYANTFAVFQNTEHRLSMFVNNVSGLEINGHAQVIQPDILLSNGIIHSVNQVIALPTLNTFLSADMNFSQLLSSLEREDAYNYVEVLSNSGSQTPITLFAPPNSAFVDLLEELNLNDINEIPTETLQNVVETHLFENVNIRAQDIASQPLMPISGAILSIDATTGTISDPQNRTVQITSVNIQAKNGVMHAVDKVLLP